MRLTLGNSRNSARGQLSVGVALGLIIPLGSLVSSPAMAERSWNYTYTPEGQLNSIDGPRTDVSDLVVLTYDTQGNLTQSKNALDQVTAFEAYSPLGLPKRIVDPNGVITLVDYNWRGQVISRTVTTNAGTASWSYGYDPVGLLTSVTGPDSVTLTYGYDDARRLTSVSLPSVGKIEFQHDAMGNVTAETIKDGSGVIAKTHTQAFDELGRLIRSIEADGDTTRFGYDLNSNLVSVTDANTQETRRAYDALNRLSSITDPLSGEVKFTYDAADNLTSVTDAKGLVTQYDYNFAGDVTAIHSPDTGTTTFEHDNAGNVVRRVDARGVETAYQYDALNRLTAIQYPGQPEENVTYHYDDTQNGNFGVGRLTGITDRTGFTGYVYDELGRVVQETRTIESQSYTTAYGYDLAGKLTGMTYPSGRVVNYQYDSAGRLTGMTTAPDAQSPVEPVVSNVEHLPFGPIKSLTYGNGMTRWLSYNQDYQLTALDSTVMARTYDYDRVGNIAGITDILAPAESQTFGYDALSRLSQASGGYGDITYDYDANGNRLSRNVTDGLSTLEETYEYATDSHHLLRVNTTENLIPSERTFGYNAAGNLIEDASSDRILTLNYNQQNRLEEVQQTTPVEDFFGGLLGLLGGETASPETLALYLHNALGQRVAKVATAPAANTHFQYNLAGQLIAETSASGALIREYLYLNGTPVAMLEADNAQ